MFRKEIAAAEKTLSKLKCAGEGKKKSKKACAAAREAISKAKRGLLAMQEEDRAAAAATKAATAAASARVPSFLSFGTLKDASTTWMPGGHANLQRSEGGRKSFNSRTVAGEWMFRKEIAAAEKTLSKLKCAGKGKKKNRKACAVASEAIAKAKHGLAKMQADDSKAAAATKAAMTSSSSWLASYIPVPMGYLSSSWRPGAGAASVGAKGGFEIADRGGVMLISLSLSRLPSLPLSLPLKV